MHSIKELELCFEYKSVEINNSPRFDYQKNI